MKKAISTIMITIFSLNAAQSMSSVVPHDEAYYTKSVRNTELIYTESNLPFARQAAKVEMLLQPEYEKLYGYTMDETLYVGLVSPYNQIANGFSTPYPNNRQINYVGGAMMVDYFASPSWLNTLLYHETAHNYQMNAKDNMISSTLHSVIRNGTFFIPWFNLPNIVESSFLLEGNAVLNESWHGNGGRLYSGRFKAATLQQAKAGYLTPERVYNDNYYFLYGSHHYTLGGQYQYYLAEQYGLEKVNRYWKEHSQDWYWPFFTNNTTERSIGIDFETAFDDWRKAMKREAVQMHDVEGEVLASTQFYTPMNTDADEIYFIVNASGRETPELVVYDKHSGEITKKRDSYIAGKVIKTGDGRYVTQAGAWTSPWRIHQGLFDADAFIIEGTQSKVIEGYLSDGTAVYFDVPSSYDQPQLYVGDAFYAQVNSSVFIDDDDHLYYFQQGEEKERTLYKDHDALFTFKSYYSYVSGVDSEGAVYFIANTPHGSGLFRLHEGKITRAHPADTIIDARLIDDKSAMVAAIGPDSFDFKRIDLSMIDEAPTEVKLFVEAAPYYRADDTALHEVKTPSIDLEEPYSSFLSMDYSGTDLAFGSDSEAGLIYALSVNFADPLTQNALSAYLLRNLDEYTLGGASYANSQYFIQFALSAYAILDRPERDVTIEKERRDFGLIAQAALPFVRQGHYQAELRTSYFQDYESDSREPLSAAIDFRRSEQYGVNMYRDYLLQVAPYLSSDRGDMAYGGEAAYEQGLPDQFYIAMSGQYSQSDADSPVDSRGIKLVRDQVTKFEESDPTTVVMPGLKRSTYVKRVAKASVSVKKVFDLASYHFTFPISLRREALYLGYDYFDIEHLTQGVEVEQVNEVIAGVVFDTLWMNKLPVPITLEYVYNDDEALAERHSFRFQFGIAF